MPLVSIITCTYNRAHLIGECIQSVLEQTWADFEYIIVDESSQDDTEGVVNNFKDKRIVYYKIPNTQGHLSKLRNFGIERSNGQYIAFIDSDDIWNPDKLLLQVKAMTSDESIGFSFTDIEMFDEKGVFRKSIYDRSGTFTGSILNDLIRNKFVVCATTLIFRKSCINEIGFEDETLFSGDFAYVLSLASKFKAFAIWESKVKVRRHDQNLTRRLIPARAHAYLTPLHNLKNKNLAPRSTITKTISKLSYTFAVEFSKQKDYRLAVVYFLKAILSNPFGLKSYVMLFVLLHKVVFRR